MNTQSSSEKVVNCTHQLPAGSQARVIVDFVQSFLCRSKQQRWPLSVKILDSFDSIEIRPVWDELVNSPVFQVWSHGLHLATSDSKAGAARLAIEYLKGDTRGFKVALSNSQSYSQPKIYMFATKKETLSKAEELLDVALTSVSIK